MAPGPPFVDEHVTVVHAPRDEVWATLEEFAVRSLTNHRRDLLRRLLGAQPPSGYGVASQTSGSRLELTGRHRFAHYWLVFVLSDSGPGTTRLAALTYASFPGWRGRAYRVVIISSKMHMLAMRRMLRVIRDLAEDSDARTGSR